MIVFMSLGARYMPRASSDTHVSLAPELSPHHWSVRRFLGLVSEDKFDRYAGTRLSKPDMVNMYSGRSTLTASFPRARLPSYCPRTRSPILAR